MNNIYPGTHRGFTLIELMIVVSIIGILAAIAMPAYMDYTVRGKVPELIYAATNVKTQIATKAQSGGTLTGSGTGLTINTDGAFISSGSVSDDGVITVTGSQADMGSSTDVTIYFTPTLQASGVVTWACTSTAAAVKYMPPSCK